MLCSEDLYKGATLVSAYCKLQLGVTSNSSVKPLLRKGYIYRDGHSLKTALGKSIDTLAASLTLCGLVKSMDGAIMQMRSDQQGCAES